MALDLSFRISGMMQLLFGFSYLIACPSSYQPRINHKEHKVTQSLENIFLCEALRSSCSLWLIPVRFGEGRGIEDAREIFIAQQLSFFHDFLDAAARLLR